MALEKTGAIQKQRNKIKANIMENPDLDNLKVKSFVTPLTDEKNKTIKGGNGSNPDDFKWDAVTPNGGNDSNPDDFKWD